MLKATFILLVGVFLLVFGLSQLGLASEVDIEKLADAIFYAEGGDSASRAYGIMINYEDEAEARQICINTIKNTLFKYRDQRCEDGESDLSCLARRYCPIGAKNDPKGLNKHWKKNVKKLYKKYTGKELK